MRWPRPAQRSASFPARPQMRSPRRAPTPTRYSWDGLLDDGRAVGNPAEPLVRALRARVGEEHERFVHLGATSQDVLDTAAMLVARNAVALVLAHVDAAADACAALAREHRSTPMAARTLLQQAVPTTFGLVAAGWLVSLLDARARLADVAESGLAVQLGGAAGTLSALGDDGVRIVDALARELELAVPTLPWHTNRVRVAELGAALATVAGVCGKIGLDVVLLSQTEVDEVREAAGGGSSAMPQKRNPVKATLARSCGALAARACLRAPGTAWCRSTSGPRAHGMPSGRRSAGRSMFAGGAAAAVAESLGGLEVDAARMRVNLDATGGLVLSERVAAALAERLGRGAAHELVAAAAGAPSFRDALLADPRAGLDGRGGRRAPRPDDVPRLGRCVRRPRPGTLRHRDGRQEGRLVSDEPDGTHARGMEVRRAVLGDAHVDRAIERTTPFTEDFQDFITRYAWGEIWSRPGLDRRTRSAITLTALVATGREHELEMHVRAALRNGLTPDEIGEVLLHCAVYCGVPAANGAFAIAQRVIDEEEAQ